MPRWLRFLLVSVVAVAVVQTLHRYLTHQAWHEVSHWLSGLLTLGLVAMASWQAGTRARWRDEAARAAELARANEALDRALDELGRCDRLVASGAAALPLFERLAPLVEAGERSGLEPSHAGELRALVDEARSLAHDSRRAMRPLDLAALVTDLAEAGGVADGVACSCVRPPEPVWVKADPQRLALAVRHFLAQAVAHHHDGPMVVVVAASEEQASVAIAVSRGAEDRLDGLQETLDWRVARIALIESGGGLAVVEEPGGLVLKLRLPRGRPPRARSASGEPVPQAARQP
jgi:signal transduction histidine kinase